MEAFYPFMKASVNLENLQFYSIPIRAMQYAKHERMLEWFKETNFAFSYYLHFSEGL